MRLQELISDPLASAGARLRRLSWGSDKLVVVDNDGWLRNHSKDGAVFNMSLISIVADDWELLSGTHAYQMTDGTRFYGSGGCEYIKLPDGIYHLNKQTAVNSQSLGYPNKLPVM